MKPRIQIYEHKEGNGASIALVDARIIELQDGTLVPAVDITPADARRLAAVFLCVAEAAEAKQPNS